MDEITVSFTAFLASFILILCVCVCYRLGLEEEPTIPRTRATASDCHICMDARCNALLACGHTLCSRCAGRLTQCPFCRRPIQQVIFISQFPEALPSQGP